MAPFLQRFSFFRRKPYLSAPLTRSSKSRTLPCPIPMAIHTAPVSPATNEESDICARRNESTVADARAIPSMVIEYPAPAEVHHHGFEMAVVAVQDAIRKCPEDRWTSSST